MNNYYHYITTNHEIMLGKPTIKGTRLTVELILRKLSQGASHEEMIKMYPQLTEEHLWAVMIMHK